MSNITPSSLFRIIDSEQPTLLIDEADTFLRGEGMRGVLNSGHNRRGAKFMRCNAKKEPNTFSTWGANTIRQGQSWYYHFKLPSLKRERKGGFRTRHEALLEGQALMDLLQRGGRQLTLEEAYTKYLAATRLKDRAKDTYEHHWRRIGPILGHFFIEDITTSVIDDFKQKLPSHLGPRTVNHHLILIRAVLRFMWKRELLKYVPYIPTEPVPLRHQPWYTQEERDQLLDAMFHDHPQWYLFFYLTCRLGLRRGEVYAISRDKIRDISPQLVVDAQVQRGNKLRKAKLITRKNNAAYTLALSQDVVDAIQWHIKQGYAGEHFLFAESEEKFPVYVDSYIRPLVAVQKKLGLRPLGHHAIGRHSVASQAATGGQSIKAIQAQLGHRSEESTHKYAHLGSIAQLRVVEALEPVSPPHKAAG